MKSRFPVLLMMLIQLLDGGDLQAQNSPAAKGRCDDTGGAVLQLLGSGGPIADDGRASSAYLVWVDGKSRFLFDAGGGAFLRFGEAGARFEHLQHVAISHFHTDHSTDLVALLKSGYFSVRTSALPISGPAGGGSYPGMQAHLAGLLDADNGAFAYLSGYLDGSGGLVRLAAVEADPEPGTTTRVYSDPDSHVEIMAMGVPHGPVPALAYRISLGGESIVFSGDQNGNLEAFENFARGANILVMHMPVPEKITGTARNLHAPPSIIGNIAASAGVRTLVLSHFMARSLADLDQNLAIIRSRFTGTIRVGDDLDCIEL